MFYLTHGDIENLFREAAENYQLSTDEAVDWGRIENALRMEQENKKQPSEPKEKNKRRFIFWCLLLIGIGWFSHYLWNYQFYEQEHQQKITSQNVSAARSDKANAPDKNIGNNENLKKRQSIKGEKTISRDSETVLVKRKTDETGVKKSEPPATLQANANTLHAFIHEDVSKKEHISPNPFKNETPPSQLLKPGEEKSFALSEQQLSQRPKDQNVNNENMNKPGQPLTENTSKKNLPKKIRTGLYAGLVASPDLTFIKFQGTTGIGSSYGLTAGYQLKGRWSIETGILFDKKKYYTKGKYFDKTNVPYLNSVNLLSVKGACEMIELPLNIRYTFENNLKSNWTASLGTSAYFMKEEYYTYSILSNGVIVHRDREYEHPSTKWFAAVNLSGGYERRITNTINIRIEPYLKIPTTGMGTGKLPFLSTGINFGVLKHFR